jgi:hypothetical protein
MDAKTARDVIEDFRTWSGGFPPDSEQEIFVYVEYARDERLDAVEVTRLLRDWMEAQYSDWKQQSPPAYL